MNANPQRPPRSARRRPPQELTGRQRRHLRSLAHHLRPLVQVGKEGVTPRLQQAVDEALDDHELIKVRLLDTCPEDRTEVAQRLTDSLGAHLAGRVGRILILYRMDANAPRIQLPKPTSRR